MSLGRYVSDLEVGDVLGPLEYDVSAFVVREYCHSVELHQPFFQDDDEQLFVPTLIHLDKLRLYDHFCPGGAGPHARVHYEFDGRFHEPVKVGQKVAVKGVVVDRYHRRGREYIRSEIELRDVGDGRLLVSYTDTALLAYDPEAKKNG